MVWCVLVGTQKIKYKDLMWLLVLCDAKYSPCRFSGSKPPLPNLILDVVSGLFLASKTEQRSPLLDLR